MVYLCLCLSNCSKFIFLESVEEFLFCLPKKTAYFFGSHSASISCFRILPTVSLTEINGCFATLRSMLQHTELCMHRLARAILLHIYFQELCSLDPMRSNHKGEVIGHVWHWPCGWVCLCLCCYLWRQRVKQRLLLAHSHHNCHPSTHMTLPGNNSRFCNNQVKKDPTLSTKSKPKEKISENFVIVGFLRYKRSLCFISWKWQQQRMQIFLEIARKRCYWHLEDSLITQKNIKWTAVPEVSQNALLEGPSVRLSSVDSEWVQYNYCLPFII